MNREDFMNQLESLLQSITSTEREEAIQYYNDYFDDAGSENEQAVIEALGNPARVAENIKRDLFESACAVRAARKVKASDRVIMEYDRNGQNGSENQAQGTGSSFEEQSRYTTAENAVPVQKENPSTQCQYTGGEPGKNGGMPVWLIALVATIIIFASPALLGIIISIVGTVFGALVTWFALIVGFGVAAVCLLLVLVVLLIVGVICLFADPWAGIALIGGGLLCGCVGILFLMLTVAMAGIATPAVCRGIASVCRAFSRWLRKAKRKITA